ncbi:MAG TPA: alpha-L-fucosidase, partial [Bacteroidales bacterium]|nr:alpha-L-fucosidase [Bacteroidales bacterium]
MNNPKNRTKFILEAGLTIIFLFLILTHVHAQNAEQYRDFGHNFAEKLETPAYAIPPGPYDAAYQSLDKHVAIPKWFKNAKFGIYAHWGVYSVPAYDNEWYPRNMYNKTGKVYKHHVETYGSPLKFGYPDFVSMFAAEQFDADQWAKLFKEAGAKFAGPVAEHHDGFSMWNSSWTPWNAYDKGPHKDIVGELEKAIHNQGLKFMTSFHHARNNLWENDGKWEGHYSYVKQYFPSLLEDPKRAIMYGYIPRQTFLEMWRGKLEEVIKNYHPDMMWFDFELKEIPDSVKTKYLAYYFNKADKWGKQVMVTSKNHQLPDDVGVQNFERGRASELKKNVWLTDDAIGDNSWSYVKNLKLKSTVEILHELIDIVSKNGVLLLNISPKASGIIPQDQQRILRRMGNWLEQNGEAIYGTRPWKVFGEGPTRLKKGGAFIKKINYTPKDIRYTQKGP